MELRKARKYSEMGVAMEGAGLVGEMIHQQKGWVLRGGGVCVHVSLTPMPAKVKLERTLPPEQSSVQGSPFL